MPVSERRTASSAARSDVSSAGGLALDGRITRGSVIQLDMDDGSTVIAPEAMFLSPSFLPDLGDIIDIFCKITGKCGGTGPVVDGGGGGRVCYKTTISPDGTIVITPVPCP